MEMGETGGVEAQDDVKTSYMNISAEDSENIHHLEETLSHYLQKKVGVDYIRSHLFPEYTSRRTDESSSSMWRRHVCNAWMKARQLRFGGLKLLSS